MIYAYVLLYHRKNEAKIRTLLGKTRDPLAKLALHTKVKRKSGFECYGYSRLVSCPDVNTASRILHFWRHWPHRQECPTIEFLDWPLLARCEGQYHQLCTAYNTLADPSTLRARGLYKVDILPK